MSAPVTRNVDPQAYLQGVFDRARSQTLSLQELFQIAEGLKGFGHASQAAELYKLWIAYNSDHALLHLVYFNYSVSLRQIDDQAGAINALRACLKLEPMFGPAHINLGRTLEDNGHVMEAIRLWREYVEATSSITAERVGHRLMTLQHIGRVFENAELLGEAEDALKHAIDLRPDKTEAGQHWIALRRFGTQWYNLDSTLPRPARISDTYLRLLLSQLQLEGYTVFGVDGPLPASRADAVVLKEIGNGRRVAG